MACVHMDVVHGLGGLQLIASRNCRSEKKKQQNNNNPSDQKQCVAKGQCLGL